MDGVKMKKLIKEIVIWFVVLIVCGLLGGFIMWHATSEESWYAGTEWHPSVREKTIERRKAYEAERRQREYEYE